MPIAAPITFVAGALTPSTSQTKQEYFNEMASKLQAFYDDSAAGFQNGGLEPTSNVGPWLKNGHIWKFWSVVTGSYSLSVLDPGVILWTGESAVDETEGEFYLCDGRQMIVTSDQGLFNAIGYNFNLPADMSGVNPIDPTKFRIPDLRGRMTIGAGTGTGLTNRVLGTLYGEENHLMTIAEMPAHTHNVSGAFASIIPGQGFAVPGAQAATQTTTSTGGSTAFNVLSPCQAANSKIKR